MIRITGALRIANIVRDPVYSSVAEAIRVPESEPMFWLVAISRPLAALNANSSGDFVGVGRTEAGNLPPNDPVQAHAIIDRNAKPIWRLVCLVAVLKPGVLQSTFCVVYIRAR